MTYPKPEPLIVRDVPPPVPPRVGFTPETVGVSALLYVYELGRVFVRPFRDITTSHDWAGKVMF